MAVPSTADTIRSAVTQSEAGGNSQTSSVSTDGDPQSFYSEDDSVVSNSDSSNLDDMLSDSEAENESGDSSVAASPKTSSDPKKAASSKETLIITDDKGKRKIEVDFSNKEELKKYVQMAHGARKWQAERDQVRTELTKRQEEFSSLKKNWDALEGAYQAGGIEGLVDLLEGQAGASKQWIKAQVDKAKFLESASPEELQAYEERQASVKTAKELEKIRKENEEFRKKIEAERETTELKALESTVNPVFNKYRFADKLGNPDDEQLFDEMLWNSAIKRLEPYEEKQIPLTQEIIEKEFRTVAQAIRRRVQVQAEKKATRAVDQKKQEATENVQSKVKSGYGSSSRAQEAREMIDNRNLTGLLKNWGKYGNLFSK